MPRKANYEYSHTLRVSKQMWEFLKQEASKRGLKPAELIRHVLGEFMRKTQEEQTLKEVKHEKRET